MLDNLRKPTKERSYKKIVAAILFGLICFSFVFLGLTPGQNNFQGTGAVAYVNSSVVSLSDFRERLEFNERQLGDRLANAPAAQRQAQAQELRKRTINELVDQQIIVQAAEKAGLIASDAAIREQILNIPAFQENGQFDRSRYDQYLNFVRATPGEFEKKVRSQVIEGQLRELFFKALKNPDSLGQAESVLRGTKFNIEFVQFTAEQVPQDKLGSIDELLKSGGDISGFVATHKLKWQETGLIDLSNSRFMPNLGEHQNVVDAALAVKSGQVVPRVVKSGAQMFIVRLKALTEPASVEADNSPLNFSMAPFEALNNWSKASKESARVKISDGIL